MPGSSVIGEKLGHYRILEQIGAGGMGVVYRVRDTRLERDAALKVLPDAFARDADRMARFQREARLLASLNHPNIAAIYGLEESGDVRAIAMELVEGQTLEQRLRNGPLGLDEALPVAGHIAEALEAAHEKGVIHRDLKPANVKVTPEGKVKVLDFGLAKALVADAGSSDLAASPTISEMASRTGIILGTAAYMSPEQARGKPLDRRTDIWSFGCLFYEMLTGRMAFGADTVSDTIARILTQDPDWLALPEATPPCVRRLLHRCLQKDPQRRLHDIADARLDIEEVTVAPASGISATAIPAAVAESSWWRHRMLWTGVLAGAVLAGLVVWKLKSGPVPVPGPVMRFAATLPQTQQLAGTDFPSVALSPTGTHLAYIASRGGGTSRMFLRSMNSSQAEPVPGSEQALSPFFSPDGQWVGFFMAGKLMKVSVNGGTPITLCPAPTGFGAVWGADDTIIFAPSAGAGLRRVSAAGGTPSQVTQLDKNNGEFSHRWPDLLPDGKTVLFTIGTLGSWDDAQIVAQGLDTGKRYPLIVGGTFPHYVSTGHLIYMHLGKLMAVPFDASQRKVTGTAVELLPNVWESTDGAAQLSASPLGHLVYVPGGVPANQHTLVWVDRHGGAPEPLAAPPGAYADPRLAPDGRRLAVTISQSSDNIWIYDISGLNFTQLTFEGGNSKPVWTPDGTRITFTSNRDGPLNLFWEKTDTGGTAERLTTSEQMQVPYSWSDQGGGLVFVMNSLQTGRDIWMLASNGDVRPVVQGPFNEEGPALSHDGRWLAYVSDESGHNEVYVTSFPKAQGKWKVSTDGGTEPLWSRDGTEIFYRVGNGMMAVRVATTPAFRTSPPQLLFAGEYDQGENSRPAYDINADGSRFLMLKTAGTDSAPTGFEFVLHWFAEIKRRAPR